MSLILSTLLLLLLGNLASCHNRFRGSFQEMVSANTEEPTTGQMHSALEKHAGNRTLAAEELGISFETLRNKIYASPDLRRRWSKDEAVPLDEIAILERGRDMTADDERLAEAVEQQDKQLRKSIQGMGLNAREVELAMQLKGFGREQFGPSMDILNAGMIRTFVKMLLHRDDLAEWFDNAHNRIKELNSTDTPMTDERVYWVEEAEKAARALKDSQNQILEYQKSGNKGAIDAAVVRYKLMKQKKEAKPGFRPMDIDV